MELQTNPNISIYNIWLGRVNIFFFSPNFPYFSGFHKILILLTFITILNILTFLNSFTCTSLSLLSYSSLTFLTVLTVLVLSLFSFSSKVSINSLLIVQNNERVCFKINSWYQVALLVEVKITKHYVNDVDTSKGLKYL